MIDIRLPVGADGTSVQGLLRLRDDAGPAQVARSVDGGAGASQVIPVARIRSLTAALRGATLTMRTRRVQTGVETGVTERRDEGVDRVC